MGANLEESLTQAVSRAQTQTAHGDPRTQSWQDPEKRKKGALGVEGIEGC